MAASRVYWPSRKGTILCSGSVNLSLTLSSPFQLSLWVLRSTKHVFGSSAPYHLCAQATVLQAHDDSSSTMLDTPVAVFRGAKPLMRAG